MPDEIEIADLSDLVMKSHEFSDLSNRLDVYCPFEALSVARMEIRHSNFLADLIDPSRPHGFEDSCTRAFLETLLSSAGELELLLKLHLADLGEIEVLREWRNIDLLLRLPGKSASEDLIFVIELKIEASESQGQLEKYEAITREVWPDARHFFFFLSIRDDEASHHAWQNVDFSSLVQNLEVANDGIKGDPKARMMLASYTQMLRRRYLEDHVLEDLAQKIWAKHKNALEFLVDRQPNPAHELARQIAAEETVRVINDSLCEGGHDLKVTTDSWNSRYIRLAVAQWDDIRAMASASGWTPSNRVLLCEIEVSDTIASVRMVIGRGQHEERQKIYTALKNGEALPAKARALSPEFSRVNSRSIRGRLQMQKLLEKGIEEADVDKLRSDIANYCCEILPKFNSALNDLPKRESVQASFQIRPDA